MTASGLPLPSIRVHGRLDRVRGAIVDSGADALVVTDLTNVRWCSGFTGSAGVMVVTPDAATLVTDSRYATQAPAHIDESGAPVDVVVSADTVGASVPLLARCTTVALEADGEPYVVRRYDHDPAAESYGLEAARALGVDPMRVFKTLVADVDGRLVVAVVPVSGQLDLKSLAAAVGGKRASMADPATAERATGYVVGGISPLGQRRRLPTVVDSSAQDWPTVWVSAGRRGVDLELTCEALVRLTAATLSPVARPR